MNWRRPVTIALFLVAVLLPWGCRLGPRLPGRPPERPKPVVELAGQSYAYVVEDPSFLPPGVGAEGRVGDLLLENAFVRFVVAAADHRGPGWPGGNLIDAAIQGGEDRMRLLAPLLGGRRTVQPVYETVRVATSGGLDQVAVVVSEGHLTGNPDVRIETVYRLRPGSSALEIATTVRNGTDAMLPLFGFCDLLYHGRTARFVPDAGLFPAGKEGSSPWLCFFGQDRVWGVLTGPLGTVDSIHRVGVSELHYATADVPPGDSRSYRRFFVAAAGGPERIWLDAFPAPEHALSRLRFALRDQRTGAPVEGAEIRLRPSGHRSPVVLVTDCVGGAELPLPAGRYTVEVRAAGRALAGPLAVNCAAWHSYRLSIPLSEPAEAVVRVRARVGQFVAPSSARVSSYAAGRAAEPVVAGPARAASSPAGVVLAARATETRLPLPVARTALPISCVVAASRGPLFDCAIASAEGEAGRTATLDLVLERVVDPGQYVAVDFRQHTDASPDCSLTLNERILADACEGLDGAVVSDPVFRSALVGRPLETGLCLIPGFRFERFGVGSFSFFPLGIAGRGEPDLPALLEPGLEAADLLRTARGVFPEAVIQVDNPLDEQKGYFALSGFNPPMHRHRPPGFSDDFDAVELLSGRNVEAARKLLAYWFSLLNSGRKVMVTGGSGSRAIVGEEAGVARTFVHCPRAAAPPTPTEILAAVRRLKQAPNAFVTNGPFINAELNGHPIGSLQAVREPGAQLRLRVYAPLWVDVSKVAVYRNGEVVEEFTLSEATRPLRCDRVLELDTSSDCWFVVHVEGDKPMLPVYLGPDSPTPFAVTNPFWVDADGDGEVSVRR